VQPVLLALNPRCSFNPGCGLKTRPFLDGTCAYKRIAKASVSKVVAVFIADIKPPVVAHRGSYKLYCEYTMMCHDQAIDAELYTTMFCGRSFDLPVQRCLYYFHRGKMRVEGWIDAAQPLSKANETIDPKPALFHAGLFSSASWLKK